MHRPRVTIDRDVPQAGREKSARIDLGLALLSLAAVPGECYSREEIAAWCGCSDVAIDRIETRALRKLHNRLRFGRDPVLRELILSVVGRLH